VISRIRKAELQPDECGSLSKVKLSSRGRNPNSAPGKASHKNQPQAARFKFPEKTHGQELTETEL